MSTDNFIGAVKVKRDEAIDSFNHSTSWLTTTLETDAHDALKKAFSDS